jgi:hypothetical protein
MGKRSRLAAAVCGILLGLVVLAGCAQAPGSSVGASPSGSPGGTVSGEPQPSASGPAPTPSPTPRLEPFPTGKPSPGKSSAIQLTGRLEEGVERCTILRADDGHSYEMYGETALPPIGTRVRVKGVVRTDIMSFCMQGPIVQVLEIERV